MTVRIKLNRLLADKGYTQKQLSLMTGIRPNAVNEMYHEMVERMNLEYLDLICEALDCEISDVLVRDKKKPKIKK